MTQRPQVVVTNRTDIGLPGYTSVHAEISSGPTGDYIVASHLVGTQGEIDEILAQSVRRMEAIDATKAGEF